MIIIGAGLCELHAAVVCCVGVLLETIQLCDWTLGIDYRLGNIGNEHPCNQFIMDALLWWFTSVCVCVRLQRTVRSLCVRECESEKNDREGIGMPLVLCARGG